VKPEDLLDSLPLAKRPAMVAQLKAQGVKVPEAYDPNPKRTARVQGQLERDLQAAVERMLTLRGYQRLTPDGIDVGSKRGYFGHWTECRRNPTVLDVLILRPDGHYLMLELKTANRWQPGQRELLKQGYGKLCCNLEEAMAAVADWEKEKTA